MILMLLAGFVYMFLGKSTNFNIAMKWHKKALPILREQFAYCGIDDNSNGENLELTSFSEFTYYASGRQNCFYSLFKMDMLRRHCMLSSFLLEKVSQAQDVLTVDIPIRFQNSDPNQPS